MITEQKEETESFQTLLWSLYGQSGINESLSKLRAKAWDRFLEIGLPTRKNDLYRYVKLRNFFSSSYEASLVTNISPQTIEEHLLPECRGSTIVFINGHFSPSLSRLEALPKRVVISSIPDAMGTYGAFLNNQWSKSLKEELDPFVTINAALHRDGVFFYFPPKTIIESPIQLLNIIDAGTTPMFVVPRLQAFAGAQSQISFVSTQVVLSGEKYAFNMVADIAIEEDTHVSYTQTSTDLPNNLWHFDALRAVLKRNSTLKTVYVTCGSETARFDYKVTLTGENGEASLNGVWMLSDKNETHTNVLIDHQAPYCRSLQLFKGSLNDTSNSAFEGKILVRQAAQKTEAFQLNSNILLSDGASANSKPNLEIFADDVKASHGSTVGQLDEDQIFYMKTRGFNEQSAKAILVYGFCQEVVNMVTIPSLHDNIHKELASKF